MQRNRGAGEERDVEAEFQGVRACKLDRSGIGLLWGVPDCDFIAVDGVLSLRDTWEPRDDFSERVRRKGCTICMAVKIYVRSGLGQSISTVAKYLDNLLSAL